MTLHVIQHDDQTIVQAPDYRIKFMPQRMLAVLEHHGGLYYGMSLLSAINTLKARDVTSAPPRVEVSQEGSQEVRITLDSDSTLWQNKRHHYRLTADRIDYWTELEGEGDIDRAYYFQGWLGDTPLACAPGFRRVFHPQPNFLEHQTFAAHQHIRFPVGHDAWVTQNIRGNGLHGAPLCWVLEDDDVTTSMSMGLLVKTGHYNFETVDLNYLEQDLAKNPDHVIGTQALSIGYHGHEHVAGPWRSPTLTLRFVNERLAALRQYVDDLNAFGGTHPRQRDYPQWTRRPVYCTWHDQVALGMTRGQTQELASPPVIPAGGLFELCTQKNCEHWLNLLLKNGIDIGTFIIDAAWQIHTGDPAVDTRKFPDLRGFIDHCHTLNIKVILWCNAWDRAGIPDNECLSLDDMPRAADPTNPTYQNRLARFVRRMISKEPNCYNADGIKLDGVTNTPCGPTLKTYDGTAGFELVHKLLALWSQQITAAKSDAILGLYTAFPYFADLNDMARTGDLYTIKGDPLSANRFRADIIRTVAPNVAIDTDGAQRFNAILPYEHILAFNRQIGVPCLYEIDRLAQRRDFMLPQIQPLKSKHYRAIRNALQADPIEPAPSADSLLKR